MSGASAANGHAAAHPCMHAGWFLHKLGKYTFLQFLNGAAVLLTFFVFRLLWGPYLSIR